MKSLQFSDQLEQLDIDKIYQFLSNDSSWAQDIPRSVVETSLRNSVCIGGYLDDEQVAFCRIITDHATFANLVDVIVWPQYRGLGIARQLMQAVMAHDSVRHVRRFTLATADAHGLYEKFGFQPLDQPQSFMQIYRPDIYQAQ
ncbi:GNAT family N-acetyltransferase [Bacterioplanes sanyensis]|uniref:GNAT family N-acetyltransferase n=1 Tax=Bacterioplanes sanyensis TaxID=1249553 RepID=A0A222FHV5_9GAMM|nr:GNAT family N-acetyltransferase [Bacterioplanes sanyensis]ASP38340.1 GNAT family N-acetyltransferase [Bacterioplanes sanyensis]